MKPNDKAIEAAAKSLFGNYMGGEKKWVGDAIAAAYAAQFPPSEDYAGLIARLLDFSEICEGKNNDARAEAADALEAVLAERDTLKSKLKTMNENWEEAVQTNSKLCQIHLKERGTLLARLAPVDDEALVEIATREIFIERRSLASAISAIRPHIEAAEREKCAKAVEKVAERINVAPHERPEWEDGYLQGVHDAAAAIRSGK